MNRNDRAITALVTVAHAAVHVYEMTIPIFVVAWLAEFQVVDLLVLQVDLTTATVGVIVTISYGLFGVGALPSGILVDRIGSRRLLGVALLGMGSAYVGLAFSPSMSAIALALVVWGAAASVYHPAGLALISKGVTERGRGLAFHGIAGNLGIGLGPLVAATLLLVVDWRTVALVFGLPGLVAAVFALRADIDETAAVSTPSADDASGADPEPSSFKDLLGASKRLFMGSFALVFLLVICSGLYYRGVLTFLPELLRGLPGFEPIAINRILPGTVTSALSIDGGGASIAPQDYFYAGLLLVGVFGQYLGGRLSDVVRVQRGLAVAFTILAVIALLFVPVSSAGIGPLLVLGGGLGIALFVVQPLYQAAVAEFSPSGTRGLSYGFTYLGVFGIGALGGGIAGSILEFGTVAHLFFTLAAIATTAGVLALVIDVRHHQMA